MFKLLSTSLLALGVMFAMPAAASDFVIPKYPPNHPGNPGTALVSTRVTTNTSAPWQAKYLGGNHTDIGNGIGLPNTNFDWFNARNNPGNGPYKQAYLIPDNINNDAQHWNRDSLGWISASYNSIGPNGYYSYMTTLTDNFVLGANQTISFSHLELHFASDDSMAGIVINGKRYTGFAAQAPDYLGWFPGHDVTLSLTLDDLLASGISWNVNGSNSVEFIVYNTGVATYGTDDPYFYLMKDNPTGLSASVEAFYQINTIPEPETYAMLLAGLAIVGGVARRRRNMM